MDCCGDIKEQIPLIVEIHKYLTMAHYKAKQNSGMTSCQGHSFKWAKCTEEELAFAYEELGLKDFVKKTNTKNEEKTKSNKKTKESGETDKGKE